MSIQIGKVTSKMLSEIRLSTAQPDLKEKAEHASNLEESSKVNHEATNAKFQEAETIRKGMEAISDETLFERMHITHKSVFDLLNDQPLRQRILNGKATLIECQQLLKDQKCIYSALETAERKIQDSKYGHFVLPELWRSEALEKDIIAWRAEDQQPHLYARFYAKVLHDISEKDPERLLGHMFVNYGSILFEGQKIKSKVQEVYEKQVETKSSNGTGIAFYTFTDALALKSIRTWVKHFNQLPQKICGSKEDIGTFEKKLSENMISASAYILTILDAREKLV